MSLSPNLSKISNPAKNILTGQQRRKNNQNGNIPPAKSTENEIKPANIQRHMLSPNKCLQPPTRLSSSDTERTPAASSAANINGEEKLFQGLQFLVGLFDFAVRLHVAGDVEADFVHQGDGVVVLALLHRGRVLFDDLCQLRLLHELCQTGAAGVNTSSTHTHTHLWMTSYIKAGSSMPLLLGC